MTDNMQRVEEVSEFEAQVGKDLGRQAAAKMSEAIQDTLALCDNPPQMVQVYTTCLQTMIKSGYPFALDRKHQTNEARFTAQAVIAIMMLIREKHPVIQNFLDNQVSETFNLSHALRVIAKLAEGPLLTE